MESLVRSKFRTMPTCLFVRKEPFGGLNESKPLNPASATIPHRVLDKLSCPRFCQAANVVIFIYKPCVLSEEIIRGLPLLS